MGERIQGGCEPRRIGDDPAGGLGLAQAYPGFPSLLEQMARDSRASPGSRRGWGRGGGRKRQERRPELLGRAEAARPL